MIRAIISIATLFCMTLFAQAGDAAAGKECTRATMQAASVYPGKEMAPAPVEPVKRKYITLKPDTLKKYVGVYPLPAVGQTAEIVMKDGKLRGLHAHHGEFPMTPVMKDMFRTTQWYSPIVKFIRDEKGKITGADLGGGRVIAIRFNRQM